ncbi:DUF4232 domain-containing protein [Streptomyces sp. NPDC090053]|uniref:DUF4232 domain-containing protein n=1 Tax=Streptomyces sp. NPDC090053 TaxID=3365932 RepID=UPI0037FEF3BB
MRTYRKNTALAATALLALSLGLTACSGSDSTAKSDTTKSDSTKSGADTANTAGTKDAKDAANTSDASGKSGGSGTSAKTASGTNASTTGKAGATGGSGGTGSDRTDCTAGKLSFGFTIDAGHDLSQAKGKGAALEVTNTSKTSCLLNGTPLLFATTKSGAELRSTDSANAGQPFTIKPGQHAVVAVKYSDTNYTGAASDRYKCHIQSGMVDVVLPRTENRTAVLVKDIEGKSATLNICGKGFTAGPFSPENN